MSQSPTNNFATFSGRMEIVGVLTLQTALRIGTGGSDEMFGADISVVKDALGAPYIPGSSFKGALRSHVEMILRTIDPELACLCVTDQPDHSCPTVHSNEQITERVKQLRNANPTWSDSDCLDYIYLNDTCRVCQVFGAPGLASKVIIPDLTLEQRLWTGQYGVRTHVSIDRDTETAKDKRLFSTETVPAGLQFNMALTVENGSNADEGLVLLGLRAFEQMRLPLGGATSRGLGRVKLEIEECRVAPTEPGALIDYLISGNAISLDDDQRLERIKALRAELGR